MALWISRLSIEVTNKNNRVCLTLACSSSNKDRPGRFRKEADKPDFQMCYFNVANDEQSYNEFVSQLINRSKTDNRIQFKIIHLKRKTNSKETFDVREVLHNLNKNNGTGTSRDNEKRARTALEEAMKMQNLLRNLVQGLNHELELSQNLFLDNNVEQQQWSTRATTFYS